MITIIETIFRIIAKKEIYGTFLIVIGSVIIYTLISSALEKAINTGKTNYEKKKRTTIIRLFQNILKYVIIILAILSILSLFGINVKTMVAGLGITATIIGLALQDTFKDIINGISIITENYFIVGDMPFMSYNLSLEQGLENASGVCKESEAYRRFGLRRIP